MRLPAHRRDATQTIQRSQKTSALFAVLSTLRHHARNHLVSPNSVIAVFHLKWFASLWSGCGEKHVLLAMETWLGTTRVATAESWSYSKSGRYCPPAKCPKTPLPGTTVTVDFKLPCPAPIIHGPRFCPWSLVGRGPG